MKAVILFLAVAQNFLLMQPIQKSIKSGDFTNFANICTEMISINLEEPFKRSGYMTRDRFTAIFSTFFKDYQVEKTEWSSLQNLVTLKKDADIYAVQSLNLYLLSRRSGENIVYKFIFFMVREKGIEWKIYYLRGIKL